MITRFLLQHTRRPIKHFEEVPDADWHTVSRHGSQRAAELALCNALGKMSERCGEDWDDSYRVTPAIDTEAVYTIECWGYSDRVTGSRLPCPTSERETVVVPWKAKTNKPMPVFSKWTNTCQCPNCHRLESESWKQKNRAVVSRCPARQ